MNASFLKTIFDRMFGGRADASKFSLDDVLKNTTKKQRVTFGRRISSKYGSRLSELQRAWFGNFKPLLPVKNEVTGRIISATRSLGKKFYRKYGICKMKSMQF